MARWSDPFSQLQREMNQLFDARSGGRSDSGPDASYGEAEWIPAVDIKEAPRQWVLHADLPGVDPATVEITLDRNLLRIKGERAAPQAGDDERYRRRERISGSFFRQFTLPDEVKKDDIQARSENGVLEITIPKAEEVQPRQISIKS